MILVQAEAVSKFQKLIESLVDKGSMMGWTLIKALIIFLIGRLVIGLLNKLVRRILEKRNVEPSVKSFLGSLINVVLMILLAVSIVGALGVETTSFAALLASAGVAIGMALSGNLSNFAGGLVILLFKPFKVDDFIESQNETGTVKEIQIFHTILTTPDNKLIYIPNGSLSSGVIINYSTQISRRLEWFFGVEYGEDFEHVKAVIQDVLKHEKRILKDPVGLIALHTLDASSVKVVVRAWVKKDDYWDVYFDINRIMYETFNQKGIKFPFPQLTVHNAHAIDMER